MLFACQCHGNKPRRIDLELIVLMLGADQVPGGCPVRRRAAANAKARRGRRVQARRRAPRQVGSWMPNCGATRLPVLR
ncbi:hypothetical protein GEV39_15845 [Pseudomonas sp. NY5710]|nr:hypothetical protein GEV39_15845 [Pseudomonas sp. NY5710]